MFLLPRFQAAPGLCRTLRRGRRGVKETGLEEADFCINTAGDLCGEEGMETFSLFSEMFNSERFHRGFGATPQILFLDYQSTHLDLRVPEATPPVAQGFLLHRLGLFPLDAVFVGLLDRGAQSNSQIPTTKTQRPPSPGAMTAFGDSEHPRPKAPSSDPRPHFADKFGVPTPAAPSLPGTAGQRLESAGHRETKPALAEGRPHLGPAGAGNSGQSLSLRCSSEKTGPFGPAAARRSASSSSSEALRGWGNAAGEAGAPSRGRSGRTRTPVVQGQRQCTERCPTAL